MLRPAIPSDLSAFTAVPLPFPIRAITLLIDGTVRAIGGLAFCPNGQVMAFMDQTAGLEKYPVAIHRAGHAGMRMIRDSGLTEVVATADNANPKALRWLRRFGFVAAAAQEIPGKTTFFWLRESPP